MENGVRQGSVRADTSKYNTGTLLLNLYDNKELEQNANLIYKLDFKMSWCKLYNQYQINIFKHDKKIVENYLSEYSKSKDHHSAQNHQTETKIELGM